MMKTRKHGSAWVLVLGGLSAIMGLSNASWDAPFWTLVATARAAEAGHSGGGHSGGGHSGGRGGMPSGHSGGHDSGMDAGHDHEDGAASGHRGEHKGGGKRGAGSGHDTARGGAHSVVVRIFGGGRPVWAREGIPEVELGRLNVGRAPGHVLERAEHEALSEYSAAMATLYNLSAGQAAALLQADYRDVARIDSPLQNLALYKDVMVFGKSQLPGVDNDQLELAAIFLGSASDKTIPVTADTVLAVNRILGLVDLDSQDRATLAAKAETVRAAILMGHGDVTH